MPFQIGLFFGKTGCFTSIPMLVQEPVKKAAAPAKKLPPAAKNGSVSKKGKAESSSESDSDEDEVNILSLLPLAVKVFSVFLFIVHLKLLRSDMMSLFSLSSSKARLVRDQLPIIV